MSVFQALPATTPCASEPASLSVFHCTSAHFRYGPYSFAFASWRAGIEPLTGLNVSCASLLPRKPQPLDRRRAVRCALRQREAVGQPVVDAVVPGTAAQP